MYVNEKTDLNTKLQLPYYEKFASIMAIAVYKKIIALYGDKIKDLQVWGMGADINFNPKPVDPFFKVTYQFVIIPSSPEAKPVTIHMDTKISPFDKKYIPIENTKLVKKMLDCVEKKLKKMGYRFF